MKKLLILSLVIVSFVSFGQNTLTPAPGILSAPIDWSGNGSNLSLVPSTLDIGLPPKLIEPKGIMWFWEYTDPNCKGCPVLIFLPGHGERSDKPDFAKIQRQGTPKLLKAAGLNYLEGFTLLVPQTTTSKNGYVGDPKNPDIIKFLTYVHENYLTEYVFATGLSMGGDGSWDASYRGYVGLVKAIAPVSCKGDYNGGDFSISEKQQAKK